MQKISRFHDCKKGAWKLGKFNGIFIAVIGRMLNCPFKTHRVGPESTRFGVTFVKVMSKQW